MIILEKNAGTYIEYALTGTALSFKGGALTVDLSDAQRDWPVSLDVSQDDHGALVLGPARRYVAQIAVPARRYTIIKGKADDFGFPELTKHAEPLDIEQVALTLWASEV